MSNETHRPPRPSIIGVFITIFSLVFLAVVTAVTLITFILPESYAAAACVKVDRKIPESGRDSQTGTNFSVYDPSFVPTEALMIQTELVLNGVITLLDLNTVWGNRYAGGDKLKTSETLTILRNRLDVHPIGNTSLIQIRVFSEDREECARIANGLAEAYKELAPRHSEGVRVQIVDIAHPSYRPVRPNKPLNIALGIIAGAVLGLGFATLVASGLSWHRKRNPPPVPAQAHIVSPSPLATANDAATSSTDSSTTIRQLY